MSAAQRSFSNKGFTLVELVIASGLVGLVILIATVILNSELSPSKSDRIIFLNVRNSVFQALDSVCAWNNTLNEPANSSMTCLKSNSDCSSSTGGNFLLRDKNNNLVANDLDSNNGFNSLEQICAGFDGVNGNDLCPFRLELFWEPICSGSPCLNPQVKISGQFHFSPATKRGAVMNVDVLNFEVVQNQGALFTSCNALLAAGISDSGLYDIDIDGAGGSSCPRKLYCDLSEGLSQGFALLANAPYKTYSSLPSREVLSPGILGRLKDEVLNTIFSRLSGSSENNIKVEVNHTSTEKLLLSVQGDSFSPTGLDEYLHSGSSANCASFASTPVHSVTSNAAPSTIRVGESLGGSFIGLYDDVMGTGPLTGYIGFTCNTCTAGGACSLLSGHCCQSQLPGALWVKW